MRLVVDINIFVSAALKQASLPYVALYQASQRCVLLKSTAIEAQLFEVLARLVLLIAPAARDWTARIMAAEVLAMRQAPLGIPAERVAADSRVAEHKACAT